VTAASPCHFDVGNHDRQPGANASSTGNPIVSSNYRSPLPPIFRHLPQRSKRLLVAVHDVTPAHEERLETLYRLLDEFPIHNYALLVVPNWHGAWPLERHPGFTVRLRERAGRGAAILLHGLRHDEVGQPRSFAHWARTVGRTDREGEFASLPPEEVRTRVALGLEILRGAGLDAIGFVPPAWLARPWLARLSRDAGLALTEDARALFVDGRRVAAPATCWTTRSAWHRAGSAVVAAARLRLERNRPLVRLALHPHDAEWPRVLDSCRRTLWRLLDQREAIGYQELLDLEDTGRNHMSPKPINSMSPRSSRSRTAAEVIADSSRSRPPL
jgi:uncharacterized protein